MSVRYLTEGFHTITPYLTVIDAAKEIEFLVKAFDGVVKFKMENEPGEIRHPEVQVGDSMLMIGQAGGPWQPMPMNVYLYVPDCDALYRSAIAQGAKHCRNRRTSSPAIAPGAWRVRRAISGGSEHTLKTSRRKRCSSE